MRNECSMELTDGDRLFFGGQTEAEEGEEGSVGEDGEDSTPDDTYR